MNVLTYTVFLALYLVPTPAPAPVSRGEISFAVLPDTQNYSNFYPAIFEAQTRWIAEHADQYNIQAVLHEGDVVENNRPEEWAAAASAWQHLEAAGLPYLVAIGNHDYDSNAPADRAATAFNALFPQARYTAQRWWAGGFYEPGRSENAYLLLGDAWLLLALEFGPRDAVLAWAADVLAAYPERRAIVVTHSYLYTDGTRTGPGDLANPKLYQLGATANDGEDVWEKLIRRQANVVWVQSGHHEYSDGARRSDLSDAGTLVHQVFANYQNLAEGGAGWLRLVTFGPGYARVQTYSPWLQALKADDVNRFELALAE